MLCSCRSPKSRLIIFTIRKKKLLPSAGLSHSTEFLGDYWNISHRKPYQRTMSQERTSFLQELRSEVQHRKLNSDSSTPTLTEERHKMKQIVEQRSEFPSKLRPAIRDAMGDDPSKIYPRDFLTDVYQAVEDFFFGRRPSDNAAAAAASAAAASDEESQDSRESEQQQQQQQQQQHESTVAGIAPEPFHWWHGPDSDVDTEEEIEVAIRFFPKVLNAKFFEPFSPLNGCCPLYMMLKCSKAMTFIPLLAELGAELGRFSEKQRGGLTRLLQNIFFHLMCNRMLKDDLHEESSGKLDEMSTAIMMRLKEKGLMKKEDIFDYSLVPLLLYRAINTETLRIETRLRFLIDWNPSILKDCGRLSSLLYHYLSILRFDGRDVLAPENLRRFQFIFRLGMVHYPNELGFLFDEKMFRWAFKEFGTGTVEQMIDDEITSKQEYMNKKTLQELVVAAASSETISLDGVYILVRRDPIACLPDSSGGRS